MVLGSLDFVLVVSSLLCPDGLTVRMMGGWVRGDDLLTGG